MSLVSRSRSSAVSVCAASHCCNALAQLCSALGLNNPWLCPGNSGCVLTTPGGGMRQTHTSSSNSSSSSGSDRLQHRHRSSDSKQQQQQRQPAASAAAAQLHRGVQPLPPSLPQAGSGPDRLGCVQQSRHGTAGASASAGASAGASASASAASPVKAARANLSGRHAAVAAADAAARVPAATPASSKQQAVSPTPAANSAALAVDINSRDSRKGSSSNSKGDDMRSSRGGVSAVATDEVHVQQHPLPSYPIDYEEQDSFEKAQEVIARLQSCGYKALIVGGWVRDKFLGRRASDIDIATNATPWELKAMFRDVVVLPRSTVKLSHLGEVLEVTCFRGISRAASLFSVASDAARRDFTINALYYDPASGSVLDFVGGVADAQQRILRLTGDSAALLAEDPLRVLRCVRFVAVLDLRLAPQTAQAVKAHAHLCSTEQGLPARRIWLELRKLHRAEQQQPGTWARSLKLCYHLGILQHLFPWLQPQQLGSSPLAAAQVQQQAVRVAERLGEAWRGRRVPLVLLVAATLHPANVNRQQALVQFEQYFQEPAELEAIRALLDCAALTHANSNSCSSSPASVLTGSSSSADDEGWVRFYAGEHADCCLDILAAWIPDTFAASFRQLHEGRMLQLRPRIERHRQLRHARQEQQHLDRHSMAAPSASSPLTSAQQQQQQQPQPSASEALQQRQRRQREELSAAIQALVGEQQGQQQQQQSEEDAVQLQLQEGAEQHEGALQDKGAEQQQQQQSEEDAVQLQQQDGAKQQQQQSEEGAQQQEGAKQQRTAAEQGEELALAPAAAADVASA